ncbi:hypothetical protein PlfCFBP13513_14965 [Plantibacter flavus]|nr:hypothetical protein PlfCFBP13513_14965 [Plantibacter flavus]
MVKATLAAIATLILLPIIVSVASSFFAELANDRRREFEATLTLTPTPAPSATSSCSTEWGEEEWSAAEAGRQIVEIRVSAHGASCWSERLPLDDSKTFDVLVRYGNFTDEIVEDVSIEGWMPRGVELVAATTYVANTANPEGLLLDDDSILDGGINIGSYSPRAAAYVNFTVKVTSDFVPQTCDVGMFAAGARQILPKITWSTAGVLTEGSC